MVTTSPPASSEMGRLQDREATPSMCTVQAPHWPMPHPYLVPLRSRTSRRTQSSGVSGATSTVVVLPLTFRVTAMTLSGSVDGEAIEIAVPARSDEVFLGAAARKVGRVPRRGVCSAALAVKMTEVRRSG